MNLLIKSIIMILIICIIYYYHKNKNKIHRRRMVNKDKNYLRQINDKPRNIDDLIKLSYMYHNGINDYIDTEGNKVYGIKPDFNKASYYYKILVENGYEKYNLQLGSIYQYGYTGFYDIIDKNIARKYYIRALNSVDQEIRTEAIEKIRILNIEENLHPCKDIIVSNPIQVQVRNSVIHKPRIQIPIPILVDNQNVHNSTIVNSIKNSIDKLKDNTLTDIEQILYELREEINKSSISKIKRINAIKTLDTMERINGDISSIGMTELEVLQLVYSRINNNTDYILKKNLKENLINELSEAVEHDKVVCVQGRSSRVLDTLNGIDNDVRIIDSSILKQEMNYKGMIIYNDLSTKYDGDILSNKFKEVILNNFRKEYVAKGLITDQKLESEIDSWNL